jgi:hypothetical protein
MSHDANALMDRWGPQRRSLGDPDVTDSRTLKNLWPNLARLFKVPSDVSPAELLHTLLLMQAVRSVVLSNSSIDIASLSGPLWSFLREFDLRPRAHLTAPAHFAPDAPEPGPPPPRWLMAAAVNYLAQRFPLFGWWAPNETRLNQLLMDIGVGHPRPTESLRVPARRVLVYDRLGSFLHHNLPTLDGFLAVLLDPITGASLMPVHLLTPFSNPSRHLAFDVSLTSTSVRVWADAAAVTVQQLAVTPLLSQREITSSIIDILSDITPNVQVSIPPSVHKPSLLSICRVPIVRFRSPIPPRRSLRPARAVTPPQEPPPKT